MLTKILTLLKKGGIFLATLDCSLVNSLKLNYIIIQSNK